MMPQRAVRWNFTVMGLDFSLFLLALSFASVYGVMPLFVHHLTHSNLALGLIAGLRALALNAPPILAAGFTERLLRKQPFILGCTVFERLPYLVLALATPLLAEAHRDALLVLFFAVIGLGSFFGGLAMPAWLDLISRMIPGDWRGRFFGYASAFGGLLGVAGGAAAVEILHRYRWPYNFALCFACAFACLIVSFVSLALGREPPPTPTPATPHAAGGYWRRLPRVVRGDRNLAWYLLATALISAASMATSFYTVDAAAGIYAIVLLAASTIGNLLWGYVGDHLGHKRVVEGGVLCTGLAAALAILVRNPAWGVGGYAVVFALVGLGTSGISLAALTFIVDFAPVEQRPTYIGLATVAGAPFAFIAPLVGGVVADRAGYPVVFALTGLLALAAALIVLRRVVDPRIQRAINANAAR